MIVEFASEGIEAACNSAPTETAGLRKIIKRAKAPHEPEDILVVLDALVAADTPLDLPSVYHFHLLKYNLSGDGAVDVRPSNRGGRGKWRMRFEVVSDVGDINVRGSIKKIIIKELLEDYHNN